jgi:hypothetical protein
MVEYARTAGWTGEGIPRHNNVVELKRPCKNGKKGWRYIGRKSNYDVDRAKATSSAANAP